MGLTWLNNGFICKELYAPFKIDKDKDLSLIHISEPTRH